MKSKQARKKRCCAFCGTPIEEGEEAYESGVTGELICGNCAEEEELDMAIEEEWFEI